MALNNENRIYLARRTIEALCAMHDELCNAEDILARLRTAEDLDDLLILRNDADAYWQNRRAEGD